jgi:hypothetical protein
MAGSRRPGLIVKMSIWEAVERLDGASRVPRRLFWLVSAFQSFNEIGQFGTGESSSHVLGFVLGRWYAAE